MDSTAQAYAREIRLNAQETAHHVLAERVGGLTRQQGDETQAQAREADAKAARLAGLVARLLDDEARSVAERALAAALQEAEALHATAAQLHQAAGEFGRRALVQILREHGEDCPGNARAWHEEGLLVVGLPPSEPLA